MLSELVRKTEILDSNATIGSVIVKMQERRALPVSDGEYLGMLYLREIVVRDFDTKAKIGSLVKKTRKLTGGMKKDEIIDAFLEFPALPYFDKGKFVGVVRAIDYIETLDLKGKACEYSAAAEVINFEDTVGVARNALKNSEVVLVGRGGEIIGGVDVFSLSNQVIPKGNRAVTPEKTPEKEIKVRPVMVDALSLGLDTEIGDAIEMLKRNYFLICGEYVLTPKTILKAVRRGAMEMKEKNKVLEIVGFDLGESFETDQVVKEIGNFAKRTEKLIKPEEIKFHLKISDKPGKDVYEIDAKVVAGGNVFAANLSDRKLLDTVQRVIEKLDAQVAKIKR